VAEVPVVYTSAGFPGLARLERVCRERRCLLRVVASVSAAPVSSPIPLPSGGDDASAAVAMDVPALRAQLAADSEAAGLRPCAVFASVGQQADPLGALRDVCRAFQVWLHAEGLSTFLAAVPGAPAHAKAALQHADSVSEVPFTWLYRADP